MENDDGPALEVFGIAKQFGAVRALKGVSFALSRGEVVGLVGDNGAGKSTLVKVLSGALEPDDGRVVLDGRPRQLTTPAEAQECGIQTVFQDLSLIPTLDITANIYLQRELFRKGFLGSLLHWMDRRAMRREATQGLEELGLTLPALGTRVAALSGGQRQIVAIARAVLWGNEIVILDEPTAALGVRQTEIVLSFIEALRGRGIAVLVVSHNMEDVLRISDRIVVLRLGRKAAELDREEATHERLVKLMVGLA